MFFGYTTFSLTMLWVEIVVLLLSLPDAVSSLSLLDLLIHWRIKMSIFTGKKASETTVKGLVKLEGVRTLYGADGKTVIDQKAVLQVGSGLFAKRFWLPLSVLSVNEVNQAFTGAQEQVLLEMTLRDVTQIDGRLRTFAANLSSMSVPLSDEALKALVSSKAIQSKPRQNPT